MDKKSFTKTFLSGAAAIGSLAPMHMDVPAVDINEGRASIWEDVGECFNEVGSEMRTAAKELGLNV